jgi:hypothetical protein
VSVRREKAVGDETRQFATRFSEAVAFLAALGAGKGPGARSGAVPAADVARALDAVEAVYRTDTEAVRDWPERRARVLAAIARVRDVLAREAPGEALRAAARVLVELLEPRPEPPAGRRRRA